jgi:LemA protein
MIWYDSYVVTTSKGGVYMNVTLIVVLVVLAVIILSMISIYNSLIRGRNSVEEAFSTMDVYLKKRFDLIPNLVETVKGYAGHEKEVFENVTKARSNVMNASNIEEASEADNQLTGALKTLFAVAENYPELKANSNFQQLQSELTETEDKISYARQFYNDVVYKYNNACEQFPSSLFARMFNFHEAEFYKAPESETAVPEVKF